MLGFIVDFGGRAVTYKLLEPGQIKDFALAGSLRPRLSGLQSGGHLVSSYAYPSAQNVIEKWQPTSSSEERSHEVFLI